MAHEQQQALADLPPLPEFPSTVALGHDVRQALREMCAVIYQLDYEYRRQLGARAKVPGPLTDEKLQAVIAFLERGPDSWNATSIPQLNFSLLYDEKQVAAVRRMVEHPDLPPTAMARLLVYVGYFRPSPHGDGWLATPGVRDFVKAYWDHHDLGMPLALRELNVVLKSAGIDPEIIGRLRLHMRNWASFTWESAAATWPYFVEHLNLLEEALEMRPEQTHAGDYWWRYYRNQRRQAAFDILAMFPTLPEQFREYCWNTALGTARKDRPLALRALHREPDITSRLIAELRSSKQDVRAAAADWLGRRREKAAIEPLKNAFAKEKKEAVKAAFLGALERLGVPADQLLNRDELLQHAEKSLQKGVPEELSWFPFERLPPIHWQNNGNAVPEVVVKHLMMEAHKLKSPEPSAMLRCYAAAMRRDEAAALGNFVLSSWIAHDTTLPTPEEADKAAQRMMQAFGAYGGNYQQFLQTCQQTPLGSAIKTKGILAVAGACCDGRAAQLVAQYLRTWYGMRAAQCKALLPMLLWVDHPAAVQLLLSTAQRFRTAGIRKEAQRCVQLLAERRDWTIAELADRSIPTCGLDEKRELVLDYGERRFVAHLDDDLNFTLSGEDGKTLTALPEPRKSEDAERVKSLKREFADARKALKTLLKQQQERFYEAMCTQREWRFADWDTFLHRHPIVSRLCQSLVWAVFQDGKAIVSFRPLPDGTLSNVDDESVKLDADAAIRLGHETTVPAGDGSRWLQHFRDYEVAPLFDQFGKPVYQLAAEHKEKTDVQDFQGHMIEAFKLRGRATKLGYTRGPAEDGGWFYRYQKQLPTLGIEAVLEFSGNGLPEENRTVALVNLHFVRSAAADGAPAVSMMDSGRAEMRIPLGEVPVILLNECWNDLRTIAAEGAGFDADWEKKVH
ncbi:MAG TPA: DUF4132 domain-containing protein [Gemmataceae bacterium]|nr:DUF4132 domain-containing protein [Gemmataceae bacterium]